DEGAKAILDLTRRLNQEGRTVILVTHHLSLLPGYANRAILLRGGRLVLDASLRTAFHDLEALASTDLQPTHAVALARAADDRLRTFTSEELAGLYGAHPTSQGSTP
ncbi:MAG TPA: hypothetical protein PKX00_15855, partial [Opitutaceae bacterium]|nr:hypothetical protein [Opitutaceae bacterium]